MTDTRGDRTPMLQTLNRGRRPLFSARRLAPALVLALAPLLAPAQTAVVHADGTCTTAASVTTCTFHYTGAAQSWTVPQGVSQATFDLYGAAGADAGGSSGIAGGKGAHVQAKLAVTACQVLGVYIGGQATFQNGSGVSIGVGGFNGGADTGMQDLTTIASVAGGGGGASDVRGPGTGLADRLAVAGGGGGAGSYGAGVGHLAGGTGCPSSGYGAVGGNSIITFDTGGAVK